MSTSLTSKVPTRWGPLEELPPRSFETARLFLRAIEPGDSKLIFDLYASDPVASKYMSFKCTGRLEDTAAFVEATARYFKGEASPVQHFVWVVSLKSCGEPIGTVGLGPRDTFALGGGYIFNQRHWGKGYASEAWKCVVEWAKGQSGVYRIEAWHDVDNPASGNVLRKAGMTREGVLRRQAVLPNVSDAPRDVVVYAWARE